MHTMTKLPLSDSNKDFFDEMIPGLSSAMHNRAEVSTLSTHQFIESERARLRPFIDYVGSDGDHANLAYQELGRMQK